MFVRRMCIQDLFIFVRLNNCLFILFLHCSFCNVFLQKFCTFSLDSSRRRKPEITLHVDIVDSLSMNHDEMSIRARLKEIVCMPCRCVFVSHSQ